MSEIRIFLAHSPNSRDICIRHPLFCHVAAGSSLWKQQVPREMVKDNTGEHISQKNRSYCELTVQYWAWKNAQADYYGFCHYRRYFSFAPRPLPEEDCGCPVFPYLSPRFQTKLCMDAETIRRRVEGKDFLIAKGIPVQALHARSVYDHYKKADGLHVRDLDLFLRILCRRHPQLAPAARSYMQGNVFYPCNMFLLRRELFGEYASVLFDVLEAWEAEAETETDRRGYCAEGLRTPGHLGERFAGIYYTYLKQKGGYRLGELQMVLVTHTQAGTAARPRQGEIPVVLAADQNFVPALAVCLRSIADCADLGRQYHIYILHTQIEEADCRMLREMLQKTRAGGSIRLDFADIGARADGYRLRAKGHISAPTYYRFLIPEIFRDCERVVYLDADLVVKKDLAQLYDQPPGDAMLAAVPDADFIGQYFGANPDTKAYCDRVLGLKDPAAYMQAGVLVFYPGAWGRSVRARELLQMAEQRDYRYSDQDILNIVCEGRIRRLDMRWNVLTDSGGMRLPVIRRAPAAVLEAYEQARGNPYIIHYAGSRKPWQDPGEDYGTEFWEAARNTPYYEKLLAGMTGHREGRTFAEKTVDLARRAAKAVLPKGSRIRRAVGGWYWRMK